MNTIEEFEAYKTERRNSIDYDEKMVMEELNSALCSYRNDYPIKSD